MSWLQVAQNECAHVIYVVPSVKYIIKSMSMDSYSLTPGVPFSMIRPLCILARLSIFRGVHCKMVGQQQTQTALPEVYPIASSNCSILG
jgi:hypothetical protein